MKTKTVKQISTPYKEYITKNPTHSVERVAKFFNKTRIEDIAAIKMIKTKLQNAILKVSKSSKSTQAIRPTVAKAIPVVKKPAKISYKDNKNYEKNIIRLRKINLLDESKLLEGEYLHLPSQTCADILHINKELKRNKFQFIGCENDRTVVPQIFETLNKHNLKMNLYNGNIMDKIKLAKTDQYAHIDFDFCGIPSKYFGDIALAMKKKVVQNGGLIFMTFNTRDAKYSTPSQLRDLIKKHTGSNFKLVGEVLPYAGTSPSNRMLFAVVKRIK